MKSYANVLLLLLTYFVSLGGSATPSPESVVRDLYQQIVLHKPIGIPKGADMIAIRPFLSRRLIKILDTAQGCEVDYFRKYTREEGKPIFNWLELGLFSGWNEEAVPSEAVVVRVEPQKDGSFHVYVRLTYKETWETHGRKPDPKNTFNWDVTAVVVPEGDRVLVDDILFFQGETSKIESRLSDSFPGCDGSRWVGDKK